MSWRWTVGDSESIRMAVGHCKAEYFIEWEIFPIRIRIYRGIRYACQTYLVCVFISYINNVKYWYCSKNKHLASEAQKIVYGGILEMWMEGGKEEEGWRTTTPNAQGSQDTADAVGNLY